MSFDISRLKNLEVNKYSKPYEEDRTKLPMNNTQNNNQNDFLGKFLQFNEFNNANQNPLLSLAKTVTGTGTDIIQDFGKGFISPVENAVDVLTNATATYNNIQGNIVNSLGLKTAGKGLKKNAENLRNFANRDLSETISKRAAQSTLPGVAYNLFNGTPQNIINNAGVEIDTNKSFGENVGNAFNKIFNNDDTSNIEGYEKSSVLGEYPDKLNQLIGYGTGLSMYGNALGNLGTLNIGGKSLGASANLGNIGVNIAGHTLNLPTLAFAGGAAEGLQDANSKENVREFERWSKALSSGFIEQITEGFSGVLGVGGSDITDKLAKKLADKFASKAGKVFSNLGVKATGEAAEEFLSYVSNYLIDNGIINKLGDADFSKEFDIGELFETMALAFVSGGFLEGTNNLSQIKGQNKTNLPIANQNVPLNQTQNAQQQVQQQTTLPMQKMAQNQTSEQLPVSYKNQAENEIKNAKISENEKNMMLDVLNNLPEVSQKDLQDIKTQINQMTQIANETKPTKSFEDTIEEAMSNAEYNEPVSPLQNRNINTIGQQKNVNAYQYDNPEVKPYYKQMAEMLIEDVDNISDKANRSTVKGGGTQLNTTTQAIKTLHNDLGYSYDDIRKGLNNIVEDHGAENNALSKKIELILDDQLRNGYRNSYGKLVDANADYINLINKEVPVETKQEPTLLKDKDGNVLKVYHGSPNSNISQFDSNLAGKNTQSDFSGIFFTDNPNVAEDFSYEQLPGNSNLSYKRGKKGSVYEKNLSYKNVLNLNEINESNIDQLEKYLDEKKGSKEEALNMMKQMANYNNAQGIKFYLDLDKVKNDYDLIIADMGGTYKGSNEYIVFDNSQIKDIEQKVENNLKQQQLDIIQKYNPMTDDYHQGIRDINDIKTFEEAMQDDESFVYGDFTLEDAEKALKDGKVTVYSSQPIEPGSFVSTSQNMAKDYAGNGQIYSQEVNLDDVAWINGDEGQYAKINNTSNQTNTLENRAQDDDLLKADDSMTEIKLPTKETLAKITTQQESVQTPKQTKTKEVLPMTENQRFRKHYESIIQSENTTPEAKKIAKELMDTDTYVPESNTKQLERADKRIETAGADSELNSLMSRAMTGGNIKADDIAVGERLIQYYSKTGDKAKLQEAIRATAMAGTTAGQTVQAMSLLNHQTPEGQAIWLQRSVEKMNNDLKKRRGQNADQFNLTEDMLNKIVNSNNAEELQQNLNEVYDELGQQVSKSTIEKLDAWRYFSMLANPKTHIRNIVGNLAMGKTQSVKNKIAGALEGAVAKVNPNIERTRTLKKASKEVKQFAKNDIKNVADRLELNDNKYNPKTRLENSMRTFKSNALENTLGKLFEFNNKALEVEDAWGLKSAYTRSLSEYMTANKLTPDNITDKQLAKARNFAIEQAKEATFHQSSALATAINQFSNKNGLTKFVADSVVPFKKTPINVAKAGLEYSPAGLAKSAIYDTVQLRKGNITVNQYIDNISKGLTGSGIALLGYALAEAGILKASGGDDDKEKYDQDRGMQTYSIQIGDNTYSLDWLAPVGIPLFIGAEVHNIMKKDEETKTSTSSDDDKAYNQAIKLATNILDAFTNTMNPMAEMSMLSGLTSALKSYDGDNAKMLANLGVNTSKSYVNQFVPTALGQVAKTTDEYERSTTSTQTGTLPKAIDSTKNQIMAKIPGLRQMLPTKTDVWGNDLKQSENVVQRALENAVLPFVRKEIQNSEVDKELTRLYDSTGESGILPDSINKNLTINKEKYVMTSDEYAKYKKQYGQTAYDLIDNLVTSKDYKNMTDEQKTTAIENIYKYANEQIKDDYAKENNLDYELSTMSNVANKLNKSDKDDYFEFTAKTKDLNKDSEKLQVLADSNYSNKAKETIYENSLGKNDNLYDTMKLAGIDINEYLNYKTQEFTSDKEDDGTTTGKSISGSKKAKVVDYVQNMNIPYNQKLLLLAAQYSLTTAEKSKVANYVNSLKTTKANKLKIYESLSGFTVYKDGRVTW